MVRHTTAELYGEIQVIKEQNKHILNTLDKMNDFTFDVVTINEWKREHERSHQRIWGAVLTTWGAIAVYLGGVLFGSE